MDKYFAGFSAAISAFLTEETRSDLETAVTVLTSANEKGGRVFLIGNGGSAAISEHMAIDLTKNAGLRASAFSDAPLLTTFANDYGYEYMFAKALECYAQENDVLMAISSSGTSKNIIAACNTAKHMSMPLITFTGFEKGNAVSRMGDINFWVDSRAFGYVEIIHNFLIHAICDAIIGSAEYMIKGKYMHG